MKNKNAQSDVISSILLILLVIVSISVIIAFVMPFIKDKISKSDCFDAAGKLEIRNTKYTCYDSVNSNMQVQILSKDEKGIISVIQILTEKNGSSSSYSINPANPDANVKMLSGVFELPEKNEERTYIIENLDKPDSIKIYPVLKSKEICSDALSSLEFIEECI